MRTVWRLPPLLAALLAGLGGVIIVILEDADFLAPQWTLLTTSTLLMSYLFAEVTRLSRTENYRWLLNPIVLCSLMTFVLGFGVTNFLYFLPEDSLAGVGLLPGVTTWMNKLMVLVLIGALAMWLGYWSGMARSLAVGLAHARFFRNFLRSDFTPRPGVLVVLTVISLVSRLIQIQIGVYGYSADYDRLLETASFRQYFSLAEGLGKLALVIAAFRYYSPSPSLLPPLSARYWLIGLLAYEVFFGFISGFKSQVIMPFIIVGICQYLRMGRIPARYVMIVPMALIAAYMVINPFRSARYDVDFTGTQLSGIITTMVGAALLSEDATSDERAGTGISILSRVNTTYIASLGVEHMDYGRLDSNAPNFLGDIFLAPVYALVPRFVWGGKETSRHGLWYHNDVMGVEGTTSVGMSPFTYLYFAGGALAVFAGFFFVGVVQRVVAGVFLTSPKAGAALPFLVLLPALTQIDSVFYSLIIELVRVLPLTLLLQYLIFRR